MGKQKRFIISNTKFVDSAKLLHHYFKEIAIIKNSYAILKNNVYDCEVYIIQVAEHAINLVKFKSKEHEQRLNESSIKAKDIEDKFKTAKDFKTQKKLIEEISQIQIDLENGNQESQKLLAAIDETVAILEPIFVDLQKLKKLIQQLDTTIILYKIQKFSLNSFLIICLALGFDFLLDLIQKVFEFVLDVKYFQLILISFLLQTFLIEPFILTKLKLKLDWKLIAKIENQIPVIDEKIKNGKDRFNDQVSKYHELNKFKVIDSNS